MCFFSTPRWCGQDARLVSRRVRVQSQPEYGILSSILFENLTNIRVVKLDLTIAKIKPKRDFLSYLGLLIWRGPLTTKRFFLFRISLIFVGWIGNQDPALGCRQKLDFMILSSVQGIKFQYLKISWLVR